MCKFISFLHRPDNGDVAVYDLTSHSNTQRWLVMIKINDGRAHALAIKNVRCEGLLAANAAKPPTIAQDQGILQDIHDIIALGDGMVEPTRRPPLAQMFGEMREAFEAVRVNYHGHKARGFLS